MTDKILIVGTGAIGGFYGALLAQAGADISVVCRNDFQQVKNLGLQVDSIQFGQINFIPNKVLENCIDYQDQADYLILCTKVLPTLDRVALIKEAITTKTSIVLIQNGIDIEQEIVDAFPDNEVISGLAFICSNRTQPGVINHLAYGRLTLGNFPDGISYKTKHLADLFRHSGLDCLCTEDIIAARWQKCVWNAPFNPLSVLSGGLLTQRILNTQERFVRQIMQDICNIAKASGHPLPDDIIDSNIEKTFDMLPYKTSMLIDYEKQQPMEIEAILGNALRKARALNLNCPYLESVYATIKLRELKLNTADIKKPSTP